MTERAVGATVNVISRSEVCQSVSRAVEATTSRVDVVVYVGELHMVLDSIPVETGFTYHNLLSAVQREFNMLNPDYGQYLSCFRQLRTSENGEPFTQEQLSGLIGDEDVYYVDCVSFDFVASSLDMLRAWFSGSSSEGNGHSDQLPPAPVDNLIPDCHNPSSNIYQESNPLKEQGLSMLSSPNSHSTMSRRMSRVDVVVFVGELFCVVDRIPVETGYTYHNLLSAVQREFNKMNPNYRQYLSSFRQLRTSKNGKPLTEEQLGGLIGDEDVYYVDVVEFDFVASSLDMLRAWFSGSSSEGSGHSDDPPAAPVDNSIPGLNNPTSIVYQEHNPLKGQRLYRFPSPNLHSTLSRRRVSPYNGVESA